MLTPLVPKFRADLSTRLKDIAEKKTGPREAETDSNVTVQCNQPTLDYAERTNSSTTDPGRLFHSLMTHTKKQFRQFHKLSLLSVFEAEDLADPHADWAAQLSSLGSSISVPTA